MDEEKAKLSEEENLLKLKEKKIIALDKKIKLKNHKGKENISVNN